MNEISKLRFWCHKILPLVYDDSLSYYEVLTKVQKKINELVDSNNEMPEAITNEITRQLDGDYATNIDDRVQSLITSICKGIATDEGKATFTENPKQGGELIWLNGTLYKVTAVMTAGTNYIVGTNIEEVKISDEIQKVKNEYLEIENEHWNERASRPHAVNTFMFWKDELYRATNDIKVNDILYDSGDNQNLTGTYFGVEIYNHYNEMHEADNNLQTQIDGNDGDIENLQNGLKLEIDRATTRENNINSRISNITAQAGNDNTEIVDARLNPLTNIPAKTLADRLNDIIKLIPMPYNEGDKESDSLNSYLYRAGQNLYNMPLNSIHFIFHQKVEDAPLDAKDGWCFYISYFGDNGLQIYLNDDFSKVYARYKHFGGDLDKEWTILSNNILPYIDNSKDVPRYGLKYENNNIFYGLPYHDNLSYKLLIERISHLPYIYLSSWENQDTPFSNFKGYLPLPYSQNAPMEENAMPSAFLNTVFSRVHYSEFIKPNETVTSGITVTIYTGNNAGYITVIYLSNSGGVWIRRKIGEYGWQNWTTLKNDPLLIKAYYTTITPIVGKFNAYAEQKRLGTPVTNHQCIAAYNDQIFQFGSGNMFTTSDTAIPINNGHGNNCQFGTTIHDGDSFPYLYCPTWNDNDTSIIVNRVTLTSAETVKTIELQGITKNSHLNACVNEDGNKIYSLQNTISADDGACNFIVSDLDGDLISQKELNYKIPNIQDMKYHNGQIYVVAGVYKKDRKIYILNLNGEIVMTGKLNLSITNERNGEPEGIAFVNDNLLIATPDYIYTFNPTEQN